MMAFALEPFSVKRLRFTIKKCGPANKRADSRPTETALLRDFTIAQGLSLAGDFPAISAM
ncbi:hypothetical protein DC522_18605 [Microvirga sp. KLBC 81]|nr:hypothetical protein DC522_18605 [Microvirga sp. KLBC 81]